MKRYAKLIGARNQAGISQTRIANYIGCSYTTYNAKENGKVKFTADDMAKIRDVLSEKLGYALTIDELFF
jgi:putative transcriptional regulator